MYIEDAEERKEHAGGCRGEEEEEEEASWIRSGCTYIQKMCKRGGGCCWKMQELGGGRSELDRIWSWALFDVLCDHVGVSLVQPMYGPLAFCASRNKHEMTFDVT